MTNQVRLPGYDASELDRLSYSRGVLVNDTTNTTIRLMDGVTPGGFTVATQEYVQNNTITAGNLASNLAVALTPYALKTELSPYALTSTVNSQIAGIPIYSLPTATTSILGGVKVDGTSITINNGVISGSNQYTLPIATTGVIGGVRPDGTTITINPSTGVISGANTYVLPTATTSVKGGVIVPAVATSGINNSSGTISLATASTTQLGGVKVDGSTITINNGIISGAQLYTLPTATETVKGGITVPAVANSGLTNTSGAIRLATATTNQLGGVKVDGVTITINGSGVIAANITGAIVFQGGWSAATNTPTLSNVSSAYNTNGFEFVTTAAGTVNFGAGNVTFAVGDNVIYDGAKWVKIPIGSSAGTTNSLLSFDNTGSGGASGSAFNGSAILTVSYNTIGASPTAGSSSLTTVGTIGTGTWNGSIIGAAYGGTGVNNSYTLTVTGANRTLDQDVASASSPNFIGTNFSGTAASLTAGNATTAASATIAGKATNIAGGANLRLAYNTGTDTTAFIAAPTVDSTYLKYTTGGLISWGAVTLATAATNIAGGALRQIHYQTAADTTGFITAPVTTGTYLQWNGTNFVWAAVSGATGGTVTSVAGTGTVSGLTLTGTVTSSGNLTLGGTLSLISPPAIGSTTPNTGAFTILTVNSASTSAVTLSPTGSGTVTISPTTAGSINNMTIGATTATTGRFTTITSTQATGVAPFTVASTTQVANLNAATAGTATNLSGGTVAATTVSASGQITSTLSTGTAPLVIASTTNVANLNASSLNGATFSAPGAIGGGTASTGAFTDLSSSGTVSGTGFSNYLASPPAIGGTAAAAITGTIIKATGATAAIGYATGAAAGGAVTQGTSRTTGVTLNKITGQITLFTAAGTGAAYTQFVVSNSTVAATDNIILQCSSSTNTYFTIVTAVAAGSFTVNFISINGTASDAPVFNFTVIKGSAS